MAQHQHHVSNITSTADLSEMTVPSAAELTTPSSGLLARVLAEAAQGRYEKAIRLSRQRGALNLDVMNARGVCYLRLGRYEEAVALFRDLVLQPGCIWMRKERPLHYKTNFATALLLGGHPGGCMEILGELGTQSSPMIDKLRSAIKKWQSTLPFGAWLNWHIGRVEPKNRPVTVDFEPGDFGFPLPAEMPVASPLH